MTDEFKSIITRFEHRFAGSLPFKSVSSILDFPFQNFEEMATAKASGRIALCTRYDSSVLHLLGRKYDNAIHNTLVAIPTVICLIYVAASIYTGKYALLAGVACTVFGFVLSSPVCKRTAVLISRLLWVAIAYLWYTGSPVASFALAGFYCGYVPCCVAREQFRQIIEAVSLQSEVVFLHLFLNGFLGVTDKSTGRVILPG
jgi:hypothetical protein